MLVYCILSMIVLRKKVNHNLPKLYRQVKLLRCLHFPHSVGILNRRILTTHKLPLFFTLFGLSVNTELCCHYSVVATLNMGYENHHPLI